MGSERWSDPVAELASPPLGPYLPLGAVLTWAEEYVRLVDG